MFGLFKNGFSLTDLPDLMQRIESEWAAHETDLKARFEALEKRMDALDGGAKPINEEENHVG